MPWLLRHKTYCMKHCQMKLFNAFTMRGTWALNCRTPVLTGLAIEKLVLTKASNVWKNYRSWHMNLMSKKRCFFPASTLRHFTGLSCFQLQKMCYPKLGALQPMHCLVFSLNVTRDSAFLDKTGNSGSCVLCHGLSLSHCHAMGCTSNTGHANKFFHHCGAISRFHSTDQRTCHCAETIFKQTVMDHGLRRHCIGHRQFSQSL